MISRGGARARRNPKGNYRIKKIQGNVIRSKSMKLKIGDIFTITISENEVGFGQIVAFPNKSTLLIIVFDLKRKGEGDYDIEKIMSSKILFLGYTLDAKLYHKHWKVIGDRPVKGVELPYNKIGTPPDNIFVTDYKGKKLRRCSIDEFDSLDYQNVIAPVRYENALKAYYGLQDWIGDDYNKLLYERTLNSIKVLSINQ
ncbi:MAG: Imm26 family immunity protein [Chitinophagaceae bacterium]